MQRKQRTYNETLSTALTCIGGVFRFYTLMAENKKSVLLYCDIIHTIKSLTDEEAGKLFKHYLEYINDLNPKSDRLTELLFEPIKQNLKRDLRKWEGKSERNSLIAKEGWKKRKDANAYECIKDDANDADKDKVTVTDKVTDTGKVIVKEKKKTTTKEYVAKKLPPQQDYTECIDFWLKEFHPDFSFGGQQGKALKSIIIKISKVLENNGTNSEKITIAETFKLICNKLPEWYKTKDLPIIDSKFNEIITEIKQQKNGKQQSNIGTKAGQQHPLQRLSDLANAILQNDGSQIL